MGCMSVNQSSSDKYFSFIWERELACVWQSDKFEDDTW